MPTAKPQLKTYLEPQVAQKFTFIAKENCRTVSKQLEFLVIQEIKKYESKNGEIIIEWN